MYIYIPEYHRHKNKNRHEHYIGNKQDNNFSPPMSLSITEDRWHTCIKLGIDIIKILSDNIGNNYVLSFVICPLQPTDWSEYYLCPSNLTSFIISLSICYYLHFKLWIYPSIYLPVYLSPPPLLCRPNHLSRLKADSSRFLLMFVVVLALHLPKDRLFPFKKADQTHSLGFLFDLKTF